MKRLKSNIQAEETQEHTNNEDGIKLKSSMRIRPQTSLRSKNEEANSITTDSNSSNKNDLDVHSLIKDVF